MDIKNIPIKQDKNPVSDSRTQVSAEEFNSIVDTVKKSVVNKLGTTTHDGELYITHKLAGGTDVLETQIPKATTSTPGIMSKEDKSNLNKAVKSVSPRFGDSEKVYIDVEFVGKTAEVINIEQATQQAAGVMSAKDKAKLDSLSPAENYPLVSQTINGDSYNLATDEEKSLTIYAPTEAGSEGHILVSTGGGAPNWIPQADIKAGDADHARLADNATKASQDSMGRVISETYLTKEELGDIGDTAQQAKQTAEKASQDVANQQATIDSLEEQIANIGDVGAASAAKDVTFTTGTSGLTKTNVQGAVTELAEKVSSEITRAINAENTINTSLGNRIDGAYRRISEEAAKVSALEGKADNAVTSVAIESEDDVSAEAISLTVKTGSNPEGGWVTFNSATKKKAGLMSAADKTKFDESVAMASILTEDDGSCVLEIERNNGTYVEFPFPKAGEGNDGMMSKEDKKKLDSLSNSGGLEDTTVVTQTINDKEYAFYAENADSEDVAIYAPTSKGSLNEVLLSSGNGAPYWASQSDLEGVSSAVRAAFAERDNEGNVISAIYATKQFVNEAVGSGTGGGSSTKSYTFNASASTAKGWYRVLTGFNNTTTGNNGVILNVAASYGNLSDAFTFLLNVGAEGNVSITQLSGIIHGENHVPKIRVDYGTSGKWYADIYIPGGEEVVYNIWGIGQGTFQIPSYISSPNGSTYEFESVTGFKPDIKEDYSDYAFYIDINKPSSKGATSVDVGGNMEMRKLWEAARKPVLMDSEGNYVELRKDNWRTTIDGIDIIATDGLDLDSSCAHCDIMEIIPEYYYKVQNYKFGESDMCRCWFSLSPIPGGRKIAQQVVGKFKAHIKENDGVEEMRSIPNVVPSSDKTIREFWLCARNKSESHGLADINFRNYLMFHTMSKYKTRNVQSLTNKSNPDYVGTGSNMSWKGMDGSSITLSETQISQGITEFDLQRTVPTGLSYSVESDGAYFADLNTKSYGVSIGGFENPYGQYWEFVQGIATSGNYVVHWEGNMVPSSPNSSLASYSFTRAEISEVMPTALAGAYETKVHTSSANQQIYMFPEEIYSISNGLLSYRDAYIYSEVGEVVCYGGSSTDNSDGLREFGVGLMAILSTGEWDSKSEKVSSRLAYYGNVRPVSYSELIKKKSGKSENRPTGLTESDSGFQYFDTTLGKTIWWNGSAWVDALGLPAVNEYAEVRHVVNGTEVKVISTDAESQGLTIYAPTEVGNEGYIVAQQGNTAAFVDPADIGLK